MPLQPSVAFDSPEVFSADFPQHDFYPEVDGWEEKERHLVSTVGYWPESNLFPLLIADDMAKVSALSDSFPEDIKDINNNSIEYCRCSQTRWILRSELTSSTLHNEERNYWLLTGYSRTLRVPLQRHTTKASLSIMR